MRRVAAEIFGKEGSTRTAEAMVRRAREAYLGLATKERSPGEAASMAATPVIGRSGLPSRVAPRCVAKSASLMLAIVILLVGSGIGRQRSVEEVFLQGGKRTCRG